MIRICCWFRWPFLGFLSILLTYWDIHSILLTFLGLSLNFVDVFWVFNWSALIRISSYSSSISKTWIDSTLDPSGSPGIDPESNHDSSGFLRYWFRLTHDSKGLPIFRFKSTRDSSEIWFWVNSWFDFESYPCLLDSCLYLDNGRKNQGAWVKWTLLISQNSFRHTDQWLLVRQALCTDQETRLRQNEQSRTPSRTRLFCVQLETECFGISVLSWNRNRSK